MKEVGQALNKYRYKNGIDGVDIPCIGIASWGYTAGKEQLERSMSTGSESATNIAIDAIHMVIELFCFLFFQINMFYY